MRVRRSQAHMYGIHVRSLAADGVKSLSFISWIRKKGCCQGHSICGKDQWLFGDGRSRQDFQEESGADGEAIAEELDVVSMMCAFRTSKERADMCFLLMHGGLRSQRQTTTSACSSSAPFLQASSMLCSCPLQCRSS